MSDSSGAPAPLLGYAWTTHRGNFRPDNEDAVLLAPLVPAAAPAPAHGRIGWAAPGLLAVVCDGVGGGAAGEIASSLAVRSLHAALAEPAELPPPSPGEGGATAGATPETETCPSRARLLLAVRRAHRSLLERVAQDRALEGMGTTLTAVWLLGPRLFFAQVGDSRLYRRRQGELTQLSFDQSLVGDLRRRGLLTEEQARRHPMRNIIDQALGGSAAEPRPQIGAEAFLPGDELLLCSDGLTDALPDRVIRDLLVRHRREEPRVVVEALLRAALDVAGRDNITALLLRAPAAPGAWWREWTDRLRAWTGAGRLSPAPAVPAAPSVADAPR
jgi:protein phosphatase